MEPTANDVKTDVKNAAQSAGQYASDRAKQVASNVSDKIQKGERSAQEMYDVARERAEDALDISIDFVKRHPFSTVAGAAAIGLVAGMLIRRSR